MKIAVMGVGGVGGYYGSLLAKHYAENRDVEVIFIARGRHLEAISTNGLKVLSKEREFTVRPALATDNPAECGPVDILVFCTKGYDLEDSARLVSPCVDENTVMISLLNGVNNPERLRTVLNKGTILNGCAYLSAHILKPGVIQLIGGSGKLFFGGESDLPVDGKGMENILRAADIDAEYSKDIERIVWEKYIFISPLQQPPHFLTGPSGVFWMTEKEKHFLKVCSARSSKLQRHEALNCRKIS